MQCPNCGFGYALPVEPLYSRETVCALVPIKPATLASWQTRNKGVLSPAQYTGRANRKRRLYTADDIRVLRAAMVGRSPR